MRYIKLPILRKRKEGSMSLFYAIGTGCSKIHTIASKKVDSKRSSM